MSLLLEKPGEQSLQLAWMLLLAHRTHAPRALLRLLRWLLVVMLLRLLRQLHGLLLLSLLSCCAALLGQSFVAFYLLALLLRQLPVGCWSGSCRCRC